MFICVYTYIYMHMYTLGKAIVIMLIVIPIMITNITLIIPRIITLTIILMSTKCQSPPSKGSYSVYDMILRDMT